MTDSMNLVTAQISFLDPQLTLIHIPIESYSLFLQPILQLLFGEDDDANVPWTNRHEFLNVSITPEGCSVICTRYLADKHFVPLRDQFQSTDGGGSNIASDVEIVEEDYIVIQVDGQGLDAGQRVLELTSPLAMAGISIFFITTYFSDYILVPLRSRRTVTMALEQRGFVFSQSADAFVSQLSPTLTFPGHHNPYNHHHQHHRTSSSPSSSYGSNGSTSIPCTPPAKDLPELQRRTFQKLQKSHILPLVDRDLRLVNCAGSSDDPASESILKNDLLQVLLSTSSAGLRAKRAAVRQQASANGTCVGAQPPTPSTGTSSVATDSPAATSFISITITATEPISIFLETRLLPRLGRTLLGAAHTTDPDEHGHEHDHDPESTLVPVTFNLQALPMEATGIVCGVAGCLASGVTGWGASKQLGAELEAQRKAGGEGEGEGDEDQGAMEVTFLSTARAGTVLVKECDLGRAMRALEFGMREAAARAPG